jgi:hypothetical protein
MLTGKLDPIGNVVNGQTKITNLAMTLRVLSPGEHPGG